MPLLPLLFPLATLVPGGAPGAATCALTPAQMRGIRVWDQAPSGMVRSTTPGCYRFLTDAQFKNETPREIASLSVRMVVELGGRRAWTSAPKSLARFESLSVPVMGAIAPMNKTGYVRRIAFDVPARFWRTDMHRFLEVVGGTTFVKPDLHDAGHLYARLMNGEDEEEIAMLERDPSLLKVRNAKGFDPTLMAFATCGPKMIRYLLAHGGSAKARTTQGATIMHFAALNPYPGVLDLALKLGGDVNARTNGGKTPLLRAIVYGQPATWRWLLAHGANPRYEESPGHNAAQYAIREGQTMALADLVKAGLNPRSKDSSGQGWFHYAIFNPLMMDAIRGYGVPVDDPNPKTGETALMTAAWSGYLEPQVWLLRHGADPNRKDKKGWSAYDHAAHSYGNRQAKGTSFFDRLRQGQAQSRTRQYFANLVRQYATKP